MASWVWTALLVPGIAAAWFYLRQAEPRPALVGGAFLAALDLVVENGGAALGLWSTRDALVSLGVTPLEVLVLAFLAGATLGPFLAATGGSRWRNLAGLALGAVAIEQILRVAGVLVYHDPWHPLWAFVAYLGALSATALVHDRLAGTDADAPRVGRPSSK